jgi:hypothetical protein
VQAFGSLGDFLDSAFGLWLTIGALASIVAVALGGAVATPPLERSLAVGAQIAQAGDQAPPDLVQELAALQTKGRSLAKLTLALVTIAAFAMSTARYW